MLNYINVGKRIQKYRLEQGKTQKELADEVGTSKNYLSDIEIGRVGGRLDKYYGIASALGVSLDMLVSDINDVSMRNRLFLNQVSPLILNLNTEQRKMLTEYLELMMGYDIYRQDKKIEKK
jgi:transcriptional regulator with XRE-family HTH domain